MPEIKLNDVRLHYVAEGRGVPLLLVHGLGGSSLDWEAQTAEFSKRYRVLVPDLRGHGQSDKPAGAYSMAMFAADMAALLRAEGVSQAHVVGLSLGGGVAFQLALDHPRLVKSLTIVNSGPHAIMETFAAKFAIQLRFVIIRLFGLQKLGEIVAKKLFAGQDALRQTFIERFRVNQPGPYQASLRAFIGWSVMNRLDEIRCPFLALTADQDYTPVAYKQNYVSRIQGAQLVVVPDAHHALPMEKPAAFNHALTAFLESHP
ncbi:MAG: alpha/beta hydrolase [Pseudomonadota bacterium]